MKDNCDNFRLTAIMSIVVGIAGTLTSNQKASDYKVLDGINKGLKFFNEHKGPEYAARCITKMEPNIGHHRVASHPVHFLKIE